MKVMLLNPPAPKPMIREGRCQSPGSMRQASIPQLSLACMGRVLEEINASVDLVECMALGLGLDEVLRRAHGCGLIFVNTTTPTFHNDMEVVKALKEAYPESRIGVFGTHVTALHEEVVGNHDHVDFVIRGEPEETCLEIYQALCSQKSLHGIQGITHQGEEGPVVEPARPYVLDLDRIARPARHLLPNECYIHPLSGKPYTVVNVSRGCPAGCIFCVAHLYYGRKLRKRSLESVLDELQYEVTTDHIWFYADDLTADRKFLRGLCQGIIDRGLKLRWWSNTRADMLDRDLYQLMARAGCFMLSIGGESGSPQVLKEACKRLKPEQVVRTVEILRETGIISLVYFLFGLPGESRNTIRETMDFARKAGPDYVEFYPATPYPGTRFLDMAKKQDLITVNDYEQYECGGTGFVVRVEGMDAKELKGILRKAYFSYYFRLGYLPILFRRLRSPVEFAKLIKFGLGYFKRFASPIRRVP
jgi:anaerobic magnesium-protoporphyrin IX monomethyl ester cyclase